ncbi:MAG: transglycosylase SLT domain-containing protein [Deltaproteobacteria bacterium]|nr:transglycosylase SLT domain-containing protein [Deltaproteobacteria bacterium]
MNYVLHLRVVGQLFLFVWAATVSFWGCGAGCSCAPKEKSRTSDDTADTESVRTESAGQTSTAPVDLVAIGRSIEFGKYQDAGQALQTHVLESDRTRYLGALLADKTSEFTQVLSLLGDGFSPSHSELGYRAALLKINALAKLERFDEAIHEANTLLDTHRLSKGDKRDLVEQIGDFHLQIKQYDKAVASFGDAARWSGPSRNARIVVKSARALLLDNQPEKAVSRLAALALDDGGARVMNDAYALLVEYHLVPDWSVEDRLKRLEALLNNKSWDEAAAEIEQLSTGANGKLAKELRWQRANMLFQRRGHYKDALEAFASVVKDGAPHGDQAAFLSARTLSRLDRDEEAIKAFDAYAKKTKNNSNRDMACFYAARLEYYLGRHGDALSHFEKLVGNGTRIKRSFLDGGTVRDAHFLAGMSAYLEKKYDSAMAHFVAGSRGSQSTTARLRNDYWHAASLFETDAQKGKTALESICAREPTNWYALFATIRLRDAEVETSLCSVFLTETASADAAEAFDLAHTAKLAAQATEPELSLEKMSSKAALYASMGLYRPAAEALHEAEVSKKVHAKEKDWTLHYLLLDAPQYAIRSASIGLNWKRYEEDTWSAMTAYPVPYLEMVAEQQKRHSLPPFLIYAIARKESLFDPFAVSYVGAMGMMQMMPATYETNRKRAGLPKLKEGALPGPADSIVAGGFELAHLLEIFDGNLPLAIMAYNGGSKAVERWISRSGDYPMDVFVEKAGFAQTRNYVRGVYQNLVRYSQLYQGPLPPLPRVVSN